jgi:biopolymer transport protein ExbD
MAASSSGDDDGLVSGINVTPLVDVCLVLLIIMMVTARIIANLGLPMDLPKAARGVEQQQVYFSIDMTKDGAIYVDNDKLEGLNKILPLARAAHEKNPEIRATIRVESSVPWGNVSEIIDLLKQAGINKVAFGVSSKPDEPGAIKEPAGKE